jgi:hypothetical protein
MDKSSEKVTADTSEMRSTPAEGKPADVNQASTQQPEMPAADQAIGTRSEHDVQESSEKQSEPSPLAADQAVESEKPAVDTESTPAPATATDSASTAGDAHQVDPVLAESVSAKPEASEEKIFETSAEKMDSPMVSTPIPPQDSNIQAGLSRDSRRSRSESTGGSSVKSGGSSASALPENVPRVGGVRCCQLSYRPSPTRHSLIITSADWAFLKPRYPDPADPKSKFELEFIHLDPVLGAHMRSQSLSMLGRGVIDFIHPEEREREWLGSA